MRRAPTKQLKPVATPETKRHWKEYTLGLSDYEVQVLSNITYENAKWLASSYCMCRLPQEVRGAFAPGVIDKFVQVPVSCIRWGTAAYNSTPEEFFEHMCGENKVYFLYPKDYPFRMRNKKHRQTCEAFYMKFIWQGFLGWIKRFRERGVYNIVHYEIYDLVAQYGFPVISNVTK